MARKVGHGHYVAAGPAERAERGDRHLHYGAGAGPPGPGYSTDGEDSRAPSDPTLSEYVIANERAAVLPPERKHRNGVGSDWNHHGHTSERSNGRPPPSRSSHHSHHRHKSPSRSQRSTSRGAHSGGSTLGGGAPSHGAATPSRHGHHHDAYDGGSDIYVTSAAYRAPSELSRASRPASHYSYRSGPARSEVSSVRTGNTRKGGVVVETMAAPNPFCPNTKGICCLMLLVNLGLILVTLGFVIVIQFFEPVFVWVLGIVFLVFGFLTLAGSLIYCVHVCRDAKTPSQVANEPHYWTHHWQKDFTTPEIRYKSEDKYNPNDHDRFSDRYSERGRHHHDRY